MNTKAEGVWIQYKEIGKSSQSGLFMF